TRLVGDPYWPRQSEQPLEQGSARRGHPLRPQPATPTVEHARDRRASMQIDANPTTVTHTGASRNCGSTAAPLATAARANLRARRRQLHTVWVDVTRSTRKPQPCIGLAHDAGLECLENRLGALDVGQELARLLIGLPDPRVRLG